MSDQSTIFRSIAIPLDGFKPASTSDDRSGDPDHLFVGREPIIKKLADLLRNNGRRGSYLIAGYRGAGKTTVINKAIARYRKEEKWKPLIVGINLGDNSQLTPMNIYYSIASILRDEMTKSRGWERFLKFTVAPRTIGTVAFTFLAATAPIAWFNPELSLTIYDYALLLFYLFILLKGVVWAISQFRHPELGTLRDVDELIERMSSEVSEGRSVDLNRGGFGFGRSKHKRRLPINAREAEDALINIFKRIQGVKPNNIFERIPGARPEPAANLRTNLKIVIVLDEIDKLSDSEELSEIPEQEGYSARETGKISKINTLLGSLKNFITTAEATFFFISGRETLDRYYSEKGSSNSLYESLFDRVFEVPSFLTDQGERPRGTRLSALVEEYVCRRIRKKREAPCNDYYSLTAYRKLLQDSPISKYERPLIDVEEARRYDSEIRQSINVIRNFIHYLTFHSWGNPKRLSSIFGSFIVLKDQIKKDSSILIMSEEGVAADHWLVFNANHQRSFSLASEITTLFSHQLGREVSKISDKLTVSTLSSLHFILKLHSYGFTRESLHRMSEAINVYRSTELNTIIDDLITHVFKSYIRRVRNGIYRYRFNSGFEQELRYVSHISELESATYNFSLDSMRHVKQYFERTLANSDEKGVIARSHMTLGDMCAIEQSYTAASVHYGTASRILANGLNESRSPVNQETLMQCIEAMIKHGDLEERRQNYNLAAAIYFEADHIVQNLKDNDLRISLLKGDSKWDLLKQPFWASHYLSLKRSPRPFKTIRSANSNAMSGHLARFEKDRASACKPKLPDYLYRPNDQRFYYRAGNLSFFLGEAECAADSYKRPLHN